MKNCEMFAYSFNARMSYVGFLHLEYGKRLFTNGHAVQSNLSHVYIPWTIDIPVLLYSAWVGRLKWNSIQNQQRHKITFNRFVY